MLIGVLRNKRSSIAANGAMVMAEEEGEAKVTSLPLAPLLLLCNLRGTQAVLIAHNSARHQVVTDVLGTFCYL